MSKNKAVGSPRTDDDDPLGGLGYPPILGGGGCQAVNPTSF